jgi:hypothetical protein
MPNLDFFIYIISMNPFLFFLVLAAFGFSQNFTNFIVIDQFGYREQARKTAVIRVPQTGSDAPSSYVPGTNFQIIDKATGTAIHSGAPTAFDGGKTDAASGDKIWWFDFSNVTAPGKYYVLDETNNFRSFSFRIANNVYNDALVAALRMLYYQRAGTDKPARYAGEAWADGFNFAQDAQTRDFFAQNDATKEKDLMGGWFDAGDYNKYTKWAADYVENLLLAYEENPNAFTDDYGIPESGNGTPDILDEAKWGIAWLLKMQNEDGAVLSVQGLKEASPPSASAATSYYGPASTTATLATAKAFAIASRIFDSEELKEAALKAWQWAEANPDVIFHNNSDDNNSKGLAAGDQELTDSWDRVENRINAAFSLYEITGEESFLKIFEDNLNALPLYAWNNFMDQYRHSQHLLYMRYLNNPNGTASMKSDMITKLKAAFAKTSDFLGAYQSDGYRSFIKSYNWGSNKYKTDYGLTFYKWNIVNSEANHKDIAEDYLHYIHGVNPFNMAYLTNANYYGTSKCATSIYHSWFDEKSEKWGITTNAQPGPAPGYVPGGPNSGYGLDACCPSGCGSAANNARCNLVSIPNKATEPAAKMYVDINHNWPVNSWEITEPMNAYQISYIRLLSKFVEQGGAVTEPVPEPVENIPVPVKKQVIQNFEIAQTKNGLNVTLKAGTVVEIYALSGKLVSRSAFAPGVHNISLGHLPKGMYIVKIGQRILRMPVM